MMLRSILYLLVLSPAVTVLGRNLYEIDTTWHDAAGAFGSDQHETVPRPRHVRRQIYQGLKGAVVPSDPRRQTLGGMNMMTKKQTMQKRRRNLQTVAEPTLVQGATPIDTAMVDTTALPTDSASTPSTMSAAGFDFIVAGFPKCGTTTLLKAFAAHPETDMAASEQCAIASPGQADAKVHKLLDQTLASLSPDPQLKRSFKCPTAIYNFKSIVRMEKHSPNAKFVVGMRHPVKMLQSFYNYRATEIKERGLDEPIPALQDVLDSGMPWKGVSMESTRFELFLIQMGKTVVSPEQLQELVAHSAHYDLAIKPTNFTVFLYTVDQLEDSDPSRSMTLRTTMQEYLGLEAEIPAFGHENQNHANRAADTSSSTSSSSAAPKASHLISICDPQWNQVRSQLVQQGAVTAEWIRNDFLNSPDVVVANREHFLETIETWSVDPCVAPTVPTIAAAAAE